MTSFVPSGFTRTRDILDRIGRELYPTEWKGEPEHEARAGLISLEQYEYEKCTPGIGSSDSGSGPSIGGGLRAAGSPDDPEYQAEYLARQRYEAARLELLTRLEAGALQAVVIDPRNGRAYKVDRNIWRRNDAEHFIDRGQAPYRGVHCEQIGTLYIKIQSAAERTATALVSDRSGAPGAPSSKHLVKTEFQRRIDASEIEQSLAEESKVLSCWLAKTHPGLRPMQARTIENSIRDTWRKHKKPQK
jgi:hypothetical protein